MSNLTIKTKQTLTFDAKDRVCKIVDDESNNCVSTIFFYLFLQIHFQAEEIFISRLPEFRARKSTKSSLDYEVWQLVFFASTLRLGGLFNFWFSQ
jgi:hypothetical protein